MVDLESVRTEIESMGLGTKENSDKDPLTIQLRSKLCLEQ